MRLPPIAMLLTPRLASSARAVTTDLPTILIPGAISYAVFFAVLCMVWGFGTAVNHFPEWLIGGLVLYVSSTFVRTYIQLGREARNTEDKRAWSRLCIDREVPGTNGSCINSGYCLQALLRSGLKAKTDIDSSLLIPFVTNQFTEELGAPPAPELFPEVALTADAFFRSWLAAEIIVPLHRRDAPLYYKFDRRRAMGMARRVGLLKGQQYT